VTTQSRRITADQLAVGNEVNCGNAGWCSVSDIVHIDGMKWPFYIWLTKTAPIPVQPIRCMGTTRFEVRL
jgi:hypothetical protein